MYSPRRRRGFCLLMAVMLWNGGWSTSLAQAEEEVVLGDMQVEEGAPAEGTEVPDGVGQTEEEPAVFYQGGVTDLRTVGVVDGIAWEGSARFRWDIRRQPGEGVTLTFTGDTWLQPGDLAVLTDLDGNENCYTAHQLAGRQVSWSSHGVTLELLLAQGSLSHVRLAAMGSVEEPPLSVRAVPAAVKGDGDSVQVTLIQQGGRAVQWAAYELRNAENQLVDAVTNDSLIYRRDHLSPGTYTLTARVFDGVTVATVTVPRLEVAARAPLSLSWTDFIPQQTVGASLPVTFHAQGGGGIQFVVYRLMTAQGAQISEHVSNSLTASILLPQTGTFYIMAIAYDGSSFASGITNTFTVVPVPSLWLSVTKQPGDIYAGQETTAVVQKNGGDALKFVVCRLMTEQGVQVGEKIQSALSVSWKIDQPGRYTILTIAYDGRNFAAVSTRTVTVLPQPAFSVQIIVSYTKMYTGDVNHMAAVSPTGANVAFTRFIIQDDRGVSYGPYDRFSSAQSFQAPGYPCKLTVIGYAFNGKDWAYNVCSGIEVLARPAISVSLQPSSQVVEAGHVDDAGRHHRQSPAGISAVHHSEPDQSGGIYQGYPGTFHLLCPCVCGGVLW